MDGEMSQSSTHSGVIAGVKRAIVISLGDGTVNEQKQGLRLSSLPNTINQEIKELEAGGTKTKHIIGAFGCALGGCAPVYTDASDANHVTLLNSSGESIEQLTQKANAYCAQSGKTASFKKEDSSFDCHI